MNPKLTVIVPVYNTKDYIDECIQSIISQDISDYELILVDDCSTDGTSQILDEWKKNDLRIKVIHKKENAGVSDSRNVGLNLAKGEYIAFVDSDDWLEPNIFSKLINILDDTEADILFTKYYKIMNDNVKVQQESTGLLRQITNEEAIMHCIPPMNVANSDVFIWNKIYRRNSLYINDQIHLMDRQYSYGEDVYWLIKLLVDVKKIFICDEYMYNYRCMRTGNTWTKISTFKSLEYCQSAIKTNTAVWKILNKSFPTLAINAYQKVLYYRLFSIRTAANLNDKEAYTKYSKRYVWDLLHWVINNGTFSGLVWGGIQMLSYIKLVIFKILRIKFNE